MKEKMVDERTHEERRRSPERRNLREGDDQQGPFTKWFSWGHMGLTVALCSLVFNFWNQWRTTEQETAKERLLLEARIVILESDMKHQSKNDSAQAAIFDGKVAALEKRTDLQRSDIGAFRDMLLHHLEQGAKK